jgi:dinuclear metal center YbgI/SA1388 family protein
MTEPSVSATVSDVVAACESLWPRNGAEEWDNTGLQVGRSSWRVLKVLLVVDVVADTVAEAIAGGFDAIISHHPLILRGIETISEETYKGRLIGELIRSNIALLSMHTNADVVPDGVSDVIAQALGLTSVAPILATANESTGIGRHGLLRNDISLGELAQKLASILRLPCDEFHYVEVPETRCSRLMPFELRMCTSRVTCDIIGPRRRANLP